jgi:hypothetical protein
MHDSLARKILKNSGFVGSAMIGVSLVSLIDSGFSIGWAHPIDKILDQYHTIMINAEYILRPSLQLILDAVNRIFRVDLNFSDNWSNVFVLMMIYLTSRIKSYVSQAKYIRSVFMSVISIFICVFCSMDYYKLDLKSYISIWIASCVPLFGFLIYDVLYSMTGSAFDRRGGSSFIDDFLRHIKFSTPLLILCSICGLSISFIFMQYLNIDGDKVYVIIFSVNYFLISAYWFYMSFRHAVKRENRNLGESIGHRMARSSATNVALNVGIVLFSAIVFILGNAGLKVAGGA